MFCTNCGFKFDDNNSFCPNCGTKVERIAEPFAAAAVAAAPLETESVLAAPIQTAGVTATPIEAENVHAAPIETAGVAATPVEAESVQAAPIETAGVTATPVEAESVQAAPLVPAPAPAPAPAPQPVSYPVAPVYNNQAIPVTPIGGTFEQPAIGTQDPELAKSILVMGILAVAFAVSSVCAFMGIVFGAIGLSKAKKFTEGCGELFGKAKVGRWLSLGGLIGGSAITALFTFRIFMTIISNL